MAKIKSKNPSAWWHNCKKTVFRSLEVERCPFCGKSRTEEEAKIKARQERTLRGE